MSQLYADAAERMGDTVPDLRKVRDRIEHARAHRRQFEPTWHSNLAFASGDHWQVWVERERRLRPLHEIDDQWAARERYQIDVMTEYRMTAIGELSSDDDRPELLTRSSGQASQEYQEQVNRAVEYAWEQEWNAERALAEVDRMIVDLGTCAVWCRWDPQLGPTRAEQVPHVNGMPVDAEQGRQLLGDGPRPDVEMRDIPEGRTVWEPLSPFNLLVPPGIALEEQFPWECVVAPVQLTKLRALYPELAADVKEDNDIGSILGMDVAAQPGATGPVGDKQRRRVRDHAWLFTFMERPCPEYPNGRKLVFAGNRMKLMDVVDRLPKQAPDGSYRSGITYFHWWRVTGRFWSRALVDAMKDPQRTINRRATQKNEIIDRGGPKVFTEEDALVHNPRGLPLEVVQLKRGVAQPQIFPGLGPGDWFYRDMEQMREDLEHATGIRGPRLGENPVNVKTYGQLALLNENDQVKRSPIQTERRRGIHRLVEDSVHDMRAYWGEEKHIVLAGDDALQAETFNATQIPPFFLVKPAKGPAKPRSQAAELTKVEDVYAAAVNSGATLQNPQEWIRWYKESLDAGQCLELPVIPGDDQADKAQIENHLMLLGQPVPVTYYDPPLVHIPIHRAAQVQAELAGRQDEWQLIEQHVQEHLAVAEANAEIAPPVPPDEAGAEGQPNEGGPPSGP